MKSNNYVTPGKRRYGAPPVEQADQIIMTTLVKGACICGMALAALVVFSLLSLLA